MISIVVQSSFALPNKADIVSRLASSPPLEELLTADDLEKHHEAGQRPLRPAAVLLLVVNHPADPTVVFTQRTEHLADHVHERPGAQQRDRQPGRLTAGEGDEGESPCDPEP